MDYEALANGLLILVTGLLSYLGIRRGIKGEPDSGVAAPAAASSQIQVAGALIDGSKADELIKAHDRQIVSNASLEAAVREHTIALGHNTEAVNHTRMEIDQAQNDIRALTLELARGK